MDGRIGQLPLPYPSPLELGLAMVALDSSTFLTPVLLNWDWRWSHWTAPSPYCYWGGDLLYWI